MSVDEIIELLANEHEAGESYVLVRELDVYLELGDSSYSPNIGIKIWKSGVLPSYPYRFSVSHNVHTPVQAGPYYPSNTHSESEAGAIREAISTTTSFLKSALEAGHEPEDSWLVPNKYF